MEITVVQKLENLLLVTVPRDMTDSDVLNLRRQILYKIRQDSFRWVLFDFSNVDICDCFLGHFIQSTANMIQLVGAQMLVSGLQEAVKETMTELGITLENTRVVQTLDEALALSRAGNPTREGARRSAPGAETRGAAGDHLETRRGPPSAAARPSPEV